MSDPQTLPRTAPATASPRQPRAPNNVDGHVDGRVSGAVDGVAGTHGSAGRRRPHVVILGAGFGGINAAMRLDRTAARRGECDLSVVNEENFSLFTPLLHEVAASDIDPSNIVNPIRKLLKHAAFYEAAVAAIDVRAKTVTIGYGLPRATRVLHYDHLLVALGSETKFFDEDTRRNAMQMKSLGDAVFLRNKMTAMLEAASVEEDAARRRRMLTFVVAGGGFAGVETIGAMNDFLRDATDYYPTLERDAVRVVLVHPGDVVLPEFAEKLGRYAGEKLRQAGVEVLLKTKVTRYRDGVVELSPGGPIPAETLVWTAGVSPGPLVQSLPCAKERGRVVVDPCMRSAEHDGLWVVGDAAHVPNPTDGNRAQPATAQHAMREGVAVAKNIARTLAGEPPKPFTFRTLGQLAAIGRRKGAANILGVNFSGFIAWFLWRSAYLSKLPRFEKKVRVALDWTLDVFFSKDVVQLITVKDLEAITRYGMRYSLHVNGDPVRDGREKGPAAAPDAAAVPGPAGASAEAPPVPDPA